MQNKTRVMAIILFLLLPVTGSAAAEIPAVPGIERVETAQGSIFYYTIRQGDTLWDLLPEILQIPMGLAGIMGNESSDSEPPSDLSRK